ncbi:hypothetical protein HPG69_002847 [Diceros bicornis minor]|uniref:NXPE C-terminal domain-containing protein n=1 Tax=Diceros bicornis minor TaxID=77932 RepID=A0A7J7ERZ1_DICBM|nr:hypothetical protein HPG69_002847 [Diceros bicornis minor]
MLNKLYVVVMLETDASRRKMTGFTRAVSFSITEQEIGIREALGPHVSNSIDCSLRALPCLQVLWLSHPGALRPNPSFPLTSDPGRWGDLLASTSPHISTYQLYALGGYLEATLRARNHRGRPKTHGGDLFWVQQLGPDLKAGVPGDVQDLENGTFLLSFPLLWAGQAEVQVRLIHSSEVVGILRGIWRHQWATVDFMGYFNGPTGYEEIVTCNVIPPLIGEEESTCHYRGEDLGKLWFCARPPILPCDSLVGHSSGCYCNVTTLHEEALQVWNMAFKVLPQVLSPALGSQLQSPLAFTTEMCGTHPPAPAAPPPLLTASWAAWLATGESICVTPCLASGPLKPVDLHATYQMEPLMALETTWGIVLHWWAHSWPLRSLCTPVASLNSVVRELGGLARGPHTVVVLGLGAHFTTFPPSILVLQPAGIQAVMSAPLAWEPCTLVVIKLANTGYQSVYSAAAADLRVVFVDAWEMTSNLAQPDNIHPGKLIVHNEVDFLLSFVCPT